MERYFIIDGEGITTKGNEPYNLGYIIGSKEEGVIITRSFLFPQYYEQNKSALYFDRNMEKFAEDLEKNPNKHIIIKSKEEFTTYLKKDLDSTGARIFLAWNCCTDWNFLAALVGEERLQKWFGAPIELSEIFAMKAPYKMIRDFCKWGHGTKNLTKTGRPSCSVNNVMKFFLSEMGIDYPGEQHNGLSDAFDEFYILKYINYSPTQLDFSRYKNAGQAGRLILLRLLSEGEDNND